MTGIAVIETAVAKKSRNASSGAVGGETRKRYPARAKLAANGTAIPATATKVDARAACRRRSKGNSSPIRSISSTSPICAMAESTDVVCGVSIVLIAPG